MFVCMSHFAHPSTTVRLQVLVLRSSDLFLSLSLAPFSPPRQNTGRTLLTTATSTPTAARYTHSHRHRRPSPGTSHADWPPARNGQGRLVARGRTYPIARLGSVGWSTSVPRPKIFDSKHACFLRHCNLKTLRREKKKIKMAVAYHTYHIIYSSRGGLPLTA